MGSAANRTRLTCCPHTRQQAQMGHRPGRSPGQQQRDQTNSDGVAPQFSSDFWRSPRAIPVGGPNHGQSSCQ